MQTHASSLDHRRPGFTDGVTAATQTHTGWSHPVRLSKDLKVARYPQDGKGAWGADTVRLAVTPKGAATVAWNWGSEERATSPGASKPSSTGQADDGVAWPT